jgi:16S rRNA (cytosine1402-N4)-methyltransferase
MAMPETEGEEEGNKDVPKITSSSSSSFYKTDYHAPVMVTECIEALLNCHRGTNRRGPTDDGSRQNPLLFVDATLGGGGHTQALLDQLQYGDVVFGVDVDAEALHTASLRLVHYLPASHPLSTTKHEQRLPTFIPIQSNFKDLGHILPTMIQQYYSNATTKNMESREDTTTSALLLVDGILMDLGVSSHQIDESTRGFAILKDGPLDMGPIQYPHHHLQRQIYATSIVRKILYISFNNMEMNHTNLLKGLPSPLSNEDLWYIHRI